MTACRLIPVTNAARRFERLCRPSCGRGERSFTRAGKRVAVSRAALGNGARSRWRVPVRCGEQLGLKLEAARAPVRVSVIDTVHSLDETGHFPDFSIFREPARMNL